MRKQEAGLFTPAEAAVLSRLSLKAVNNAIDKKTVVALLLKYPELMQRPIVIRGKRAIIARPPEKLEALL